jgi:Golgi nucleoside diphosphatase
LALQQYKELIIQFCITKITNYPTVDQFYGSDESEFFFDSVKWAMELNSMNIHNQRTTIALGFYNDDNASINVLKAIRNHLAASQSN